MATAPNANLQALEAIRRVHHVPGLFELNAVFEVTQALWLKRRARPRSPGLAEALFDLLTPRRREAMRRGWCDVPEHVFCSATGTPMDTGNVSRTWFRLRRRAQAGGIRPLKLHSARHTWATLALASGKSIRWVADQPGDADPAMTLRVYAHALSGGRERYVVRRFRRPRTALYGPSCQLRIRENA